jgi:hypothetical protein
MIESTVSHPHQTSYLFNTPALRFPGFEEYL